MNIHQINNINFKANIRYIPTQEDNKSSLGIDNPIKSNKKSPIITPDYNVKVPQKYSSLGTIELPCNTKAHNYKLASGQRVVIIPKKGPTIVKTYVNTGSMNEPDNVRGISHFIEHNLFNGSEGLDAGEFFSTVNKMGAYTNASTSFAATDYYIQSNLLNEGDLENKIKLHATMLETPKFANNMLEKEKGPVTSEINMILDDPENIATNNTIKLLYNIKTTSKDVIGGTVDNINKLTQKDVIDYYSRNYYPSNMVTVITGDVTPDETMKLISKYFKSEAQPTKARNFENLTPINKTVRNDIISDKTNASIVSIGFSGPKNNQTKDKILLDAFQFFLVGSSTARLNKTLDKIETNAYLATDRMGTKPTDNTVILFSTQTTEENIENAIKLVFDEINDLETNPPTKEELAIVKNKLKLNLAQVFESSELINQAVGTAMLDNDIQSVMEFEKVIDEMTSKDMVEFAKKYFDMSKVAITVVHPQNTNTQTINENYQKTNAVSFGKSIHKEAIDATKLNQYDLPNNMQVTTQTIDKNLVALDMVLKTEAPADIKPGVAEILSIILNRGTAEEDKKTFFTNLETQGIQADFDATENQMYVNAMFLPKESTSAIKEFKKVLLNPRFTEEDLKYAKNLIMDNLITIDKNSQDALMAEMFKGQFYATTPEDILANLDNIKLEDIEGFYQYLMNNAQAQTAISAPFDNSETDIKSEILSELCTDFQTFKPAKASLFDSYIPVTDKNIVVQTHNKSQAEIQMGYKFKTNKNLKDNATFAIMNTILGGSASSRLFLDLRETQKLAYQVCSKTKYVDNSGVEYLYIKTTTDNGTGENEPYNNLEKSIIGFNKHIEKMVKEGVTEEELESAKLSIKNSILNNNELTADKNISILLGAKSFYGATSDNQALELIDSITKEDIQAAAKYIFSTNPTISIVATENTINANSDYLKQLGNIIRK